MQHGKPHRWEAKSQPDSREGQAGPPGVADRPVVPLKPGNSGGGKGPEFKEVARRGNGQGEWRKPTNIPIKTFKIRRRRPTEPNCSRGRAWCFLVREPDAGKPPVRFDERGVETERQPPRHSSTGLPPKSWSSLLMGIVQLAESQGAIHAKTTDY